ncbi:uncharacterized protein TNIN_461971 [Trichonephila inaurata madagascariensis]|uniref:Tetratricopeptide repeat protein 29 n=1 Tax=Trichonephila inaurata madagascariensis TaxID=2747483 RepID=A0A8X6YE78_9ARAC|nr:uncharacterized protein TNIN_461971 [Trichonephila inaurata madagascariensis]
MYLSLSQECDDKYSVCNAYFALSEIYKRIGNLEKSIQALTKCQSQAKENGFLVPLIFSSISFGQLNTAQRRYLEAHENFEVAYRTLIFYCDKLPNKIELHKLCRVMSGVGRAHCSFNRLIEVLQEPPEKALGQLLTWRNTNGPFDGKIILKQDHLINLDKEEMEDEETKRFALIQQLIKEELNVIFTQI